VLLVVARATSPPDVDVVLWRRTRLVSLRQFALADALVSRGALAVFALFVLLLLLIAVGQGALLCCAVLTLGLVLVFCAAMPGATNAPSPTTIAVIRW